MDHYGNIGNATVGGGGVHFNSGHNYLLEVLTIFDKLGRKGDQFFITELLIHESDDPKLPPGFKASWTANWKHDATLGNVKGYLAALNGIPVADKARMDREITADVARFAASAANPLKGRMVELSAVGTKTRAGGDFTMHVWSPTKRPANPAISAKYAAEAAAAPAASTGYAPSAGYPPTVPGSAPALPAAPAPFPPPGWQPHPQSPGWFHNGVEVLSEADLRKRAAPPPVAPAPPPIPVAPAPPPIPAAPPPAPFPPPGWQPHPSSPGWFHNGVEVLSEAQLRLRGR